MYCPEKITPQVIEFAESILPSGKPVYIECTPLKGMPVLECFPIVAEKVRRSGGKMELGWSIYVWPNVFIEAELHAVWVDELGNRRDIAPHQFPMKQILFLPDPTASYGERHQEMNRRLALQDDPLIHSFIAVAEAIYEEENRGELAKKSFFIKTPRWTQLQREMLECQMKLSVKYGLPPSAAALINAGAGNAGPASAKSQSVNSSMRQERTASPDEDELPNPKAVELYEGVKSARDVDKIITALRGYYEACDKVALQILSERKNPIACCEGCSHCCYQRVSVLAHEVFAAVEYVEKRLTAEKRTLILKQLKQHAEDFGAMSIEERDRRSVPCPFLIENRCGIYPARPMNCRSFHSLSREKCEMRRNNPESRDLKVIPVSAPLDDLRKKLTEDLDKVFHATSFDQRTYDLGFACLAALSSNLYRRRWWQKKAALFNK